MKAKIIALVPYTVTYEGKTYDKYYMLSVSPSETPYCNLFANLDKIPASKATGLYSGALIDISRREDKSGKQYVSSIVLLDKKSEV